MNLDILKINTEHDCLKPNLDAFGPQTFEEKMAAPSEEKIVEESIQHAKIVGSVKVRGCSGVSGTTGVRGYTGTSGYTGYQGCTGTRGISQGITGAGWFAFTEKVITTPDGFTVRTRVGKPTYPKEWKVSV